MVFIVRPDHNGAQESSGMASWDLDATIHNDSTAKWKLPMFESGVAALADSSDSGWREKNFKALQARSPSLNYPAYVADKTISNKQNDILRST